MEPAEALNLIEHVNESGGGRFVARPLDLGHTNCWVLVADKHTPRHDGNPHVLEPIADFQTHLARARRERAIFPDEYVMLLETWDAERRPA